MGKRLFLLILCGPLFWIGGTAAYSLIRQAISGWSTPTDEKLAKEVEAAAAEFKTRDNVRLINLKTTLVLAEKEPRAGDLSSAEKDVLEALEAYGDRARSARLGIRILAGDTVGELPKEAELFREWQSHKHQADEVRKAIDKLFGAIKEGLGTRRSSADVWDKQAAKLLKDNEKLPRKFFTFSVQKNEALLHDCAKLVALTGIDKAEAGHFTRLDDLVAKADEHNLPRFQDLAQALAFSWLDGLLSTGFKYDDTALIFNTDNKRWEAMPRPLKKIKLNPAKADSLADDEHKDKQFERVEFYVEGAGTAPVCPTAKSFLAYAYKKTRAEKMSPRLILNFAAFVEEKYFEVIKVHRKLPDSPVIVDPALLRREFPQMWTHIAEIQQLVTPTKALFGAR